MFNSIRRFITKQRLIGRLNRIKASVDNVMEYEDYGAKDFRAIKADAKWPQYGNCAVYAASYQARLDEVGIKGHIYYGIHKARGAHAVVLVPSEFGPYVMDNFGRSVWPYDSRDWALFYMWTGEVK
ncbi:hypothetical protein EBZ38_03885 [bacterium]|nr:hypothetical protein [bacterium]